MSTQMAHFGTQLEDFVQAQHSLIQQFGDFQVATELRHQALNTRIDHIKLMASISTSVHCELRFLCCFR